MLIPFSKLPGRNTPSRQKGVVLLITLIMLVAMTLAAIALIRSVDTTNLVAGNLAFQQTSFNAADRGTEEAINYLYTVPDLTCNGTGVGLACAQGYKSFHEPGLEPPAVGATWDSFWNSMIGVNRPGVKALTTMPAGYSGAFVIEAWCTQAGRQRPNCSIPVVNTVTTLAQGADMGSQVRKAIPSVNTTLFYYYRITTRVVGPRNSVGYVQTFIAAQSQ